ncbi:hypothetical protein O3M35_003779 [Rhynocoris fuscipes]|uniref:SUI1 domain-containing protein n=1 Tax=Rhynocoris fuscipes TaxID=488301 RepID=A0AAW1CHE6_9HEMI
MFKKPFKVKSNCQLKGTEKRKLYSNLLEAFPNLSRDALQISFPSKFCINQMKVVTHQGETITVYLSDKRPMILVMPNDQILPTLYFLWNHPNIIKYFTTSKFVLNKISNGADLMVPGIIVTPGTEETVFNEVNQGAAIAINIVENYAAHAVGISLMDTDLLLKSGGHGKAVNIIHTYGDFICKSYSEKVEIPKLSLTDIEGNLNVNSVETPDNVIVENIESAHESPSLDSANNGQAQKTDEIGEEFQTAHHSNDEPPTEQLSPDEILKSSFLRGVLLSRNKLSLPVLTNIFYKNYILSSVPSGINFDIKKTRYKKLSLFLSEMEKEGVIILSTTKNNVQSINDINYKHPLVTQFNNSSEVPVPSETTEVSTPVIDTELKYVISSQTVLFFSKCGFQKGEILKAEDVDLCVRSYLERENLTRIVGNKTVVTVDPILSSVLKVREESILYPGIVLKLLGMMGTHYVIKKDGEIIKEGRGNIPKIELSVKVRSSNKKVTIITNLPVFGINLNDLSRQCQHTLAASATINKCGNKNDDLQLQVQGSHIKFIKRLLTDKYGVPQTYIIDK